MNKNAVRHRPLPKTLQQATETLGAKVAKTTSIRAIATLLAAIAGSWLTLFVLDRLHDTGIGTRLLVAALGWVGVAAAFVIWYRKGVVPSRSELRLAKLVKEKFGGPGDRFLGILELSRQPDEVAHHSEALYEAAAANVDKEIAKLEIDQAVDERPTRKALAFCGAGALLVLAALVSLPEIAGNAFARWINPWADIPRLTLAKLEQFPSDVICAQGETVVLRCILADDSRRRPDEATLVSPQGTTFTASRNGSLYEFALPGQYEVKDWRLNVGDAEAKLRITPLERPSFLSAQAILTYPEYLALPDSVKSIEGGSFTVLQGTRTTIRATAQRPLAGLDARTESRRLTAAITEDKDVANIELGPMDQDIRVRVRLTDHSNLTSGAPTIWTVQAVTDKAPLVDFENLPGEIAILETETLALRALAQDDFGVSEIELLLTVQAADGEIHNAERLARSVREGSLDKESELLFPFDPGFLGLVAGDTATLTAHVLDRKPGRVPSVSREIRLFVVDPEEHAEAIRRQMEEILARVSEITREEEAILVENLRISEEIDDMAPHQAERALADLADNQRNNAGDLRRAAKDGSETLKEALRNPLFDENTLKDWSETVRKMENVAGEQMADAAENLDQARAQSSQASQASQASQSSQSSQSSQASQEQQENLANAEQAERDALEQLQEIQAEANEQMDNLEAFTLAQRLRHVQKTQDRLGESLVTLLPDSIGQRPDALSDKHKETQGTLESTEREAHEESDSLQGEISRFHERTGKEAYGEVGRLMEEERAAEGLEATANLIRQNVSFDALDNLDHWAERFAHWADLLDEANQSGGGGGGGGGGGEVKDITKQLIALLRIRDKQNGLIGKTAFLARKPAKEKKNEETASQLSALGKDQREIMTELTDVQVELAAEPLNELFDEAHSSMATSAQNLEDADTGKDTTQAQTDAKDDVTDLINLLVESTCKQCQGSSNPQDQAQAQALQFLLQQLAGSKPGQGQGMKPGQTGGGSRQGGGTERVGATPGGSGDGNAPGTRKPDRAGGANGAPPPEFRNDLEDYFRLIEQ